MDNVSDDPRTEYEKKHFTFDRLLGFLRTQADLECCANALQKVDECGANCEANADSLGAAMHDLQWLIDNFYTPDQLARAKIELSLQPGSPPADPLAGLFTASDLVALREEQEKMNRLVPLIERLKTGRFPVVDIVDIHQQITDWQAKSVEHLMPGIDSLYGTQTQTSKESA